MRKEIIETGKTVEGAIDGACAKLGYEREEVEWEIIDLPRKGFLGLKIIPAKVKVWKELEETEVAERQPPQRKAQTSEKKAPYKENAAPAEKKQQDRPRDDVVLEMTPEIQNKADAAQEYLGGICREMNLNPVFAARLEDGGLCINVEGEGLGAMIGRRGETLDALQYLCGLVANRLEGEYLRLTLDCGDYRAKRKTTLEALAKKLSSQVLKTNTSKMLEPMNPFERRIIHATVSEIEGVYSSSVGEEPNRRVIITSPTARSRARSGPGRPGDNRDNRDKDSRGSGDRSGNRDRGDRSVDRRPGSHRRGAPPRREPRATNQGGTINTLPQNPGQPPKQTPEAANADKPLYTKLDLE